MVVYMEKREIKIMENVDSKYYKRLEEAYNNGNCKEIIECLEVITKKVYKREDLVFKSIYMIIQNGYYEEARVFLNQRIVLKKNEFKINLLKKSIVNEENFSYLNDDEKEVFYSAIELGGKSYRNFDVFTAYDYYLWGLYYTSQPIFLYYIGKMLYKNKKFDEAEKLLLEYVEVGSSKISKAYLYLSCIAKKRHNFLLAEKYSNLCNMADEVYGEEFELLEYYNYDDNEDIDILKLKIQNQDLIQKRAI